MSTRQVQQAVPASNLFAAATTNQVFAAVSNPLVAASLPALGTHRLGGRKFIVRASGVATSAGSATTFSPFLAVGTSLAIASDTIIAQATAVTINSTSCPWWIEGQLIFDGTSGKLQGIFTSLVNNTFGASASVSTVVTGLSEVTEPPFLMVTGGQFSVASAGNILTLAEFVLEE